MGIADMAGRCTKCGKDAEKRGDTFRCCGRSWIVLPKTRLANSHTFGCAATREPGAECDCGKDAPAKGPSRE